MRAIIPGNKQTRAMGTQWCSGLKSGQLSYFETCLKCRFWRPSNDSSKAVKWQTDRVLRHKPKQDFLRKKNPKTDQQIAERERRKIGDKRRAENLKRAAASKKAKLQKQQENERKREMEDAGRKRKRDVATAVRKKQKTDASTLVAISVLSLVAAAFVVAGRRRLAAENVAAAARGSSAANRHHFPDK